ncbi:CocE/NonD family hydrolase [Brachyspira alvinipulli]|uniref:CocE/NonD family hydrolase n=1 Tax=Brachyspira alvinipulli TaxID=84379 RepID=UPI0004879C83|nr:CocE/NonD family hydrolase [Brachyspira alvinipulli]
MRIFNLYQSGILISKFHFDNSFKYLEELDFFNLSFKEKREINKEDIKRYIFLYYMDLELADKILNIKDNDFSKDEININNILYKKHSDFNNIYAAMSGKNPLDIIVAENSVKGFIIASRDSNSIFIEEGYEDNTFIKEWKKQIPNEKLNSIKEQKTVYIPMRDGVKLATEVLIPNVKEKVPTILVRTPYNRLNKIETYYRYVLRGYAVCVQDVRGRGDSDGEWIPKYHEVDDGDDTINFIANEQWCNGSVGMIGGSYLGCVQWSAAGSGNEHLKALISIVTSGNPFVDLPRKNGTFSSGVLAWAFSVKDKVHDKNNMQRTDWDEVINIRPIKDIPIKALGHNIGFWDKWCSHEVYDEFWAHCNWYEKRDNIKTPALIVSGWYDDNGDATSLAIDVVSKYKNDSDKKIILGAWMHDGNSTRNINSLQLGTNALRYDIDLIFLKWFDKKLKNINNDIENRPNVEYYAVGKNEWKQANKWYPEYSKPVNYYLSANNKLSLNVPETDVEEKYIFNPKDAPEHLIDISQNEICVPADYQEIEKRDDVIIFTTEEFEKETTIVGSAKITFYAKSSAKDTDFVVRLTEVDSKGRSMRLCDGFIRAKFREGVDKISLLEPGKIYKYEIVTTKIANTFLKGTKLRLQVMSGAKNYIFPNQNTGNNIFEDTEFINAEQTIISSKEYPSFVELYTF